MLGLGNIKSPLTGGDMEDPITTQDMVIAPSVRETASEDGAVLLDIEQGICFSLNPVGLRIWELLKKRHSVDQIADALAQDFPVSRSQLLSDVVEFLQSLEAKRLIHLDSSSGPHRGQAIVAHQGFPVGKGTRTTPLEHTSWRLRHTGLLGRIIGGHTWIIRPIMVAARGILKIITDRREVGWGTINSVSWRRWHQEQL